ncbi:MAG: c-type cytochrome [Chitinophagaceae bacterium]|nr:MAG: c-type cytochrome [Chitinophagaceae bacterium]
MKKLVFLLALGFFVAACGGDGENKETKSETSASNHEDDHKESDENPSYDPKRGEGKFKDVDIPDNLDLAMATSGEKVYGVKCAGCHKLTDERLVGPGWKGVTMRHTPEWIMNFSTNTDEMLDKDPKAQAQLEICLVRMPNQNLTDDDARTVYEFMRQNDGVK